MVATYDPNLRVTEQGTNDNPNTWGSILNGQVISLLCDAIAGVVPIDFSAGVDIDISTSSLVPPNNLPGVANGAPDTSRNAVLELTSSITPLTVPLNLTIPAVHKVYLIRGGQTGAAIHVKPVGGLTYVAVAPGSLLFVYTNGTSIYSLSASGLLTAANNLSDLTNVATARTNLGLANSATLTAGTAANNLVQLNGSGKLPAVDGSLLTNVTGTPTGVGTAAFLNVGTAAGNIPQLNGSAQLPAVDGSLLTGIAAQVTGVLGVPGKIVFSSLGITLQWGTGTSSPGGLTVNFGTAFSGAPYMIWGASDLPSGANITTPTSSWTSSSFLAVGGNGSGGSETCKWIAIGPT